MLESLYQKNRKIHERAGCYKIRVSHVPLAIVISPNADRVIMAAKGNNNKKKNIIKN